MDCSLPTVLGDALLIPRWQSSFVGVKERASHILHILCALFPLHPCRHDRPNEPPYVLRELKHAEGRFEELRAKGAPGEGPAWADGDTASQAFSAAAPVGHVLVKLEKLVL